MTRNAVDSRGPEQGGGAHFFEVAFRFGVMLLGFVGAFVGVSMLRYNLFRLDLGQTYIIQAGPFTFGDGVLLGYYFGFLIFGFGYCWLGLFWHSLFKRRPLLGLVILRGPAWSAFILLALGTFEWAVMEFLHGHNAAKLILRQQGFRLVFALWLLLVALVGSRLGARYRRNSASEEVW